MRDRKYRETARAIEPSDVGRAMIRPTPLKIGSSAELADGSNSMAMTLNIA
jgi:hypothetical protein